MYWYISFLRPAPVGLTLPSDGVVITPQVANDLRTELREEPTPISYVWHRVSPPLTTKPAELTLFDPPASTYRPLTVPLPRTARPGERWRLGLFSPPSALESPLLSLAEERVPVMGVWSEGIELRAGEPAPLGPVRGVGAEQKGNGKGKGAKGKDGAKEKKGKGKDPKGKAKDEAKQTRISRVWPLPGGGELKLVEQTSFDLDKKVWDSGLALAAWLFKWYGGSHPHAEAREAITRLKGTRSLELGSGTGLVGIALALLDPEASITATDLDSAMEIMRENIALNGTDRVTADVLDWEAPLPEDARTPVVIAADVTYNTASFPALVNTLEGLLKVDTGEPPRLLLAYKQRDAAERELWTMLRDRGIGTVLVDSVQGAEERGTVEIWVGGVGIA